MTIGKPLLGICLGMQWLYETSDESPELQGLGLFPGACTRLTGRDSSRVASIATGREGSARRMEHAGLVSPGRQRLDQRAASATSSQVYFTHSYVAPVTRDSVAVATHGDTFAAIVERGAVAGVQFHPEKSGEVGLRILRNFVERTH